MISSIAHIGIAVRDLDSSIRIFQRLFGRPPDHVEEVPDQRVRTAMFRVGASAVELTAATDSSSTIARFIERRGEGVHHLSFVVDDLRQELARLKDAGFQLIDEEPRPGADDYDIAFLHPKSTNGVLIELSQKRTTE